MNRNGVVPARRALLRRRKVCALDSLTFIGGVFQAQAPRWQGQRKSSLMVNSVNP